jgi:hypothetical protein
MAVFTNMMNKMLNKMKTNKKACCVLCFVLFILFFVTMDSNVYEGLDKANSVVDKNQVDLGILRDRLRQRLSSEIDLLGSGPITGSGPMIDSSLLDSIQGDTKDYQNKKYELENSIAAKKNK